MAKQASIELKNLTKEYVTHEGTGTFLAVDHINAVSYTHLTLPTIA